MKRAVKTVLTVIITICMSLSACTSTRNQESTQSLDPNIEVPLESMFSYAEYLDFIETTALPADFVYYDSLQHFGTFDALVILSNRVTHGYSHYFYAFLDADGSEYGLYVEHPEANRTHEKYLGDLETNMINKNDMRTCIDNATGYYTEHGIEYTYISGKLSSASWMIGEIRYTILLDSDDEYSLDSQSALAALLNIQGKTSEELFSALSGNEELS